MPRFNKYRGCFYLKCDTLCYIIHQSNFPDKYLIVCILAYFIDNIIWQRVKKSPKEGPRGEELDRSIKRNYIFYISTYDCDFLNDLVQVIIILVDIVIIS